MPMTELIIRNLTTPQSFERGQDYYHTGAVLDMRKRGNTLLARVEGSSYEPYEVTVEKHYHHAVRWLERARRAYLGVNREEEWQIYLESLISKHVRKYSLRPQLEALRI